MKAIKQCVGIDISKKSFTACICTSHSNEYLTFSEVRSFANDRKGFNQLARWAAKQHKKSEDAPLVFLMEATGVFHESLAHHLYHIKKEIHVVLPNKSKHYFSSLNIKTKTDKRDAQVLARFGVERRHGKWVAPDPVLLGIRNLTRYYVQLNEQKTALNNIKLNKESAHNVQSFILKSRLYRNWKKKTVFILRILSALWPETVRIINSVKLKVYLILVPAILLR